MQELPGNSRRPDPGWWPAPAQELLLRASLFEGPKALDAWERWAASVDLDTLDTGSFRMLPLLYDNLRRHGVSGPLVDRLKGVYRFTWAENQAIFHSTAGTIRALREAGVETLLLKGAALIALCYKNEGLRPVYDCDVLIRFEQVDDALELLVGMGFRPLDDIPRSRFRLLRSLDLKSASGRALDLHWHVLDECLGPGGDDDFWDASIPVTLSDLPTRTLNPTDHLLHTVVHGARWDRVPSFRWIADVHGLLASAAIDWDRLAAQARKRAVALTVADALGRLRDRFGIPLPEDALAALRKASATASRLERMELAWKQRQHSPPGPVGFHLFRYWRMSRGWSPTARLGGLIHYCQDWEDLRPGWRVPGRVARKVFEEYA